MTARRVVYVLLGALVAYFGVIGYLGVILLGEPPVRLKALGVAVFAFPVIGVWVVLAELRFGRATERLAHRLDADGVAPDPDLPRMPSGRVDRRSADALFERRRLEVEADPADWRGWYQLATAYDLAGDRRRARGAMRHAISLAEPAADQ